MNKKWILFFIIVFLITIIIVVMQNVDDGQTAFKEIELSTYKGMLDHQESFIIYVNSRNCEPCKILTPKLEDILNENDVEVVGMDVSIESNVDRDWFERVNIIVTPTLIAYKEGIEVDRLVGNKEKDELEKFLKANSYE